MKARGKTPDGSKLRPSPLRETSVYTLLLPALREIVQEASQAVASVIFEARVHAPPLSESPVRAKLRASAADLRHLHQFARAASDQPDERDFSEDSELLDFAFEASREIARIAVRIEQRIGPPPGLADSASDQEPH